MPERDEDGETSIERLPEVIAALPERECALAERLFQVVRSDGRIVPPPEMLPLLADAFGSVERALRQRAVRVTNRWTYEGTVFNPLRALRPGSGAGVAADVDDRLRE